MKLLKDLFAVYTPVKSTLYFEEPIIVKNNYEDMFIRIDEFNKRIKDDEKLTTLSKIIKTPILNILINTINNDNSKFGKVRSYKNDLSYDNKKNDFSYNINDNNKKSFKVNNDKYENKQLIDENKQTINTIISPKSLFRQLLFNYKNNHKTNLSELDWKILDKIAELESGYNMNAKNNKSQATGYFLFLPSTLSDYYKGNINDLVNNPELLIDVAIKHYNYLKNRLQNSLNYVSKSNLSEQQIMYGMWWRPKSMENYLKNQYDGFETSDTMNIKKVINKAK